MRIAGLALVAVVFQTSIALAQPQVEKVAARDPKLEAHLKGWQDATAGVRNYRAQVLVQRYKPEQCFGDKMNTEAQGTMLAMKPNTFRIRLINPQDSKDYEEFLNDGKSLFIYSGLQKTVTEIKPTDCLHAGISNNLSLGIISGTGVKGIIERCDVKLFKEDDHYVYLDIMPKLAKDKLEFGRLRLALCGPKTDFSYLTAQIYVVKPSGEMEHWKLTEPRLNTPGITEKLFQYENVPGFRLIKSKHLDEAPALHSPP